MQKCQWSESGEGLTPCEENDLIPIKHRHESEDEVILGHLCRPHALEWSRTHITSTAPEEV